MSVRVRFAPSPTGYLHMGGARTALFNWLYARHHGGTFLLRIEDTDRQRSTEESVAVILDGLGWLGIESDEAPVFQSARVEEHRQAAYRLLEAGHAYRDYMSSEAIDALREEAKAKGEKPRYVRDQEAPSPDAPYVVRFKMPRQGSTTLDDLLRGPITVDHNELDDLVILRSDGTPTYNFVVVCDDAHMAVTHVIRGDDHLTNTFRQIPIYRALGHELPSFGHVPLIKGLSKRLGSASIQAYRDEGYLAEGALNYLARLGWAHGDDEIFSRDELIAKFDLDGVSKSPAAFDATKMQWVNSHWLKTLPGEVVAERLVPFLTGLGFDAQVDAKLLHLVEALRERAKTLVDMAASARFAYEAPTDYDPKSVKKWIKPGTPEVLEAVTAKLAALGDFTPATIEPVIRDECETRGLGLGKVAQPIRICLTGSSVSPPLFDTLAIVGQSESVDCLERGLAKLPALKAELSGGLMSRELLLAMASGTLERQGARLVDFSDETVTVESGLGGRKRVAEVRLRPLLDWIADHPVEERVGIASFFRGIGAAVLAPRLSRRESSLGFTEVAARVMPSLEGPLYRQGASAVLGDDEALFGHDTFGGLWVSYFMEVDAGRRLVTDAMVADWGVSAERAQKGGQSLLFHRSYNVVPTPYPIEGAPGCQGFQLGDSFDATRALILDTLLYQRALGGLLIAVPSCDLCLLMDLPEAEASDVWDAFEATVGQLWKQSAWPLSNRLFTVKLGLPQEVVRDG